MAAKNTRNSRAVKCNWKYPNCKNTTRDQSGLCQVHRPLSARLNGADLSYGGTETEINNRSRFIFDKGVRGSIYSAQEDFMEAYPVIKVREVDGRFQAIVYNVTMNELVQYGVTPNDRNVEGPSNSMSVTRDTREEAVFDASAISTELWAKRVDSLEARNLDYVDAYDSSIEAIAYARDWKQEVSLAEQKLGLAPNGRTISFSEDNLTKQLAIKVYQKPKSNDSYPEYDYVLFMNKLRSVTNDGVESFLPHTRIDDRQSYSVQIQPNGEPKRIIGSKPVAPVTRELMSSVAKLVAETNKFGIVGEDGRFRIPAGWERRSAR